MPAANIFSLPAYLPDPTSQENIVGYDVQYCPSSIGIPVFTGAWSTVTGSPFTSNLNILDTNSSANSAYQYRARPIRQVTSGATTYTLDTPYSKPFTPSTELYDGFITRNILPAFRFVYLKDEGMPQINGTLATEVTGSGQGTWAFDGQTTRFTLQYVTDDDPIHVLDSTYVLYYRIGGPTGTYLQKLPDVDYTIDVENGTIEFATAPAAADYARLEFRRVAATNQYLYRALMQGINSMSTFGLNGYSVSRQYNLWSMGKIFPNNDLVELLCHITAFVLRTGYTESALRETLSWRDGASGVDPFPSRGLEFLVMQEQFTEKAIRHRVNTYLKGTVTPRVRGDFEMMFDMTQLSPVSANLFRQFSTGQGAAGPGAVGGFFYPWWVS